MHMLHANLDYSADPYLYLTDEPINVLSIFDDLKYDRSDFDGLSPSMRRYAVKQLAELGFKQTSGRVLEHAEDDVRCIMPKPSVLGASPFDIERYNPKRQQDYYLLTPTQTAALLINHFPLKDSLDRILELVVRHPINLFKIKDHLESNTIHEEFAQAIPHIKYKQRLAVESPPLCKMKCLKI